MNENEETVLLEPAAVPCIICGEFVKLNERETRSVLNGTRPAKVCHGCKDAVIFIKKKMMETGL